MRFGNFETISIIIYLPVFKSVGLASEQVSNEHTNGLSGSFFFRLRFEPCLKITVLRITCFFN